MTTMLIANNCTRDNGQFMGDQLCYVKVAYLMVQNTPCDKVIMSMSPANEMHFVWQKFIDTYNVEVVYDTLHPGDNPSRWEMWDKWRVERSIEGHTFDHYRELYLRIHGAQRQHILCGSERGLGKKNIFEYIYYGQEHLPETCIGADWFDDTLVNHPPLTHTRDVYISPHCKTQGNYVFTFEYWTDVVHRLIAAGISVTIGYEGYFCDSFLDHPLFKKHWGNHEQWFDEVCQHKIVACGNTATGWVAAACGVPLITMEPHNSVMADHRYRQCGLRNIIEVIDGYTLDTMDNNMVRAAEYCAQRIIDEVNNCVVMTTGCYDVLHAGHVRHLERSRNLGTKLIVALNSDASVKRLKGPTRPINSQEQRKIVLEALRCVNEVRIFEEDTAVKLIAELKPAILTNGFGHTEVVGADLVATWGGRTVITCRGDAALEPSTTKTVAKILRSGDVIELCRVAGAVSVNSFIKLKLMADHFLKVADLPGDVADLGAYRGGTSLILRRLAPEKQLHIFDTWEGNPYDDELCHHKKGEWAASLSDCQSLVGQDVLTCYQQGTFPNSAAGLEHNEFCFVYVDMDTYQSTKDAIEFFWPRMVEGGEMFFDDWEWTPCAGVEKAVREQFPEEEGVSYQRTIFLNQHTCIVTKR